MCVYIYIYIYVTSIISITSISLVIIDAGPSEATTRWA